MSGSEATNQDQRSQFRGQGSWDRIGGRGLGVTSQRVDQSHGQGSEVGVRGQG